jgi:hypothetical protein
MLEHIKICLKIVNYISQHIMLAELKDRMSPVSQYIMLFQMSKHAITYQLTQIDPPQYNRSHNVHLHVS